MKKIAIEIISVLVIGLRTGSIFEENDMSIFIAKAIFAIIFILIAFLLVTSKRSKEFLKVFRRIK